jgi:hypothetical protein
MVRIERLYVNKDKKEEDNIFFLSALIRSIRALRVPLLA